MRWLSHQHREFLGDYASALLHTPQIFRHIAFRRRTLEEELQEALLRGSLRKAFRSYDLLLLGLGIVIGSGWAQLTGSAAQQYSGASIILSFLFAGLAALLAAVCYAELCLEFPVSGGAFSYVMVTFGEFPAFVALGGLLLEYALGMAAVARGFSTNFAALCNLDAQAIRFWVDKVHDGHSFDLLAAGIVLLMSLLLSIGVKESAHVITAVTGVKLVMVLVVAVVGYSYGGWPNPQGWQYSHWSPFLNPAWDVDGIFVAASFVFFSFTGFDAIGNAAEEVQNVRHLPWAIVGTVIVSSTAYFMLALALVVLTWPNISCPACTLIPDAPPRLVNFISAFVQGHGLKWMQYFLALTALFGILTALMVGLFSASRIVMVAARDWLLPPFLARVSKRTQTPLVAQMVLGVIIALLAFTVEVEASTSMVSLGTLVALWLVCNAQMYRRYFPDLQLRFTTYGTVETAPAQQLPSWALGQKLSLRARKALVWAHIAAINGICIGLYVYYAQNTSSAVAEETYCPAAPPAPPASEGQPASPPPPSPDSFLSACYVGAPNRRHNLIVLWFVLAWVLATLSFQLVCPLAYRPEGWHVPRYLMPWLPSAAIVLLLFSLGALPESELKKTGIYFAVLLVFYLLFSLPMSYIKHNRVEAESDCEDFNIVELACVDGKWQPMHARYPGFSMATATSARSSLPGAEAALKSGSPRKQAATADSAAPGGRPGSVTAAAVAVGTAPRSGSVTAAAVGASTAPRGGSGSQGGGRGGSSAGGGRRGGAGGGRSGIPRASIPRLGQPVQLSSQAGNASA